MNEGSGNREGRIRRVQGFNTVSPQGVRKKNEVDAASSYGWLQRGVGLLLIAGTLGLGAYFVADPVAQLLERPLASVMVEGDFHYISKERAMELISKEIDAEFLQLDLMRLKTVLESEPWVEHAALIRRWPDALEVKITEQQPIARWGDQGFLNQRGQIIRVGDVAALGELPLLQGSETEARRIMQQYQDLSQLLRSRGLDVKELKCDNKKSWKLKLKDDVEVAIGRDQVMKKMHRFITVYDQYLSNIWHEVKAVDVRYTNGVAVQWLPESEAKKNYIKSM